MKKCGKCKRELDESEFHARSTGGHLSQCKDCQRASVLKRYKIVGHTGKGVAFELGDKLGSKIKSISKRIRWDTPEGEYNKLCSELVSASQERMKVRMERSGSGNILKALKPLGIRVNQVFTNAEWDGNN